MFTVIHFLFVVSSLFQDAFFSIFFEEAKDEPSDCLAPPLSFFANCFLLIISSVFCEGHVYVYLFVLGCTDVILVNARLCMWIITLQHTATYCNTLQHTATRCETLQHVA